MPLASPELARTPESGISLPRDEFGDFQTPIELARAVTRTLNPGGFARVLEPTCGIGNFLRAAQEAYPHAELQGVEVQEHYAAKASEVAPVVIADAMRIDFARDLTWQAQGDLLVIGNPPWVTNADLTTMDSTNKPRLKNIRGLKGLDALTGASNFDIAEAIILKLLAELADQKPVLAMLCKTQVARNVLSYADQFKLPVGNARIYEIDAKRWFGALVDACLFVLESGVEHPSYVADLYTSLDASAPVKQIGVVDGRLVSNVEHYVNTRAADGLSPFEWRQGIKHDATNAAELVERDGPHTKAGVAVDVEPPFLFPMLKCTDVFKGRTAELTKWMVVPQRHTGDDTRLLQHTAPKLWAYLEQNASIYDNRKSSIYRNRARFCIFGVGPYSFEPYKVAVSAMHKAPIFRLVAPIEGKPVVFDDVCYFTSFATVEQAAVVAALLQSQPAQELIDSLVFTDSKRPITKKLLQRLDLGVLAALVDRDELLGRVDLLCSGVGARDYSASRVNEALDDLLRVKPSAVDSPVSTRTGQLELF